MGIIMPWGPDTTVTIYSGVNFDPTYANIRLFESNGERDAYLEPLVKERFLYCSVVSPGVVRLTGQQQNFISCDYLRFQNHVPGQPERPIFCFIRSVDYVNNNTFSVTFDIDWVMSWMTDIIFQESFVIKEHVNDDSIGMWQEDEGYEIGEMQVDGEEKEKLFTPAALVGFIGADSPTVLKVEDNIVSALEIHVYALREGPLQILKAILNDRKEKPELVPYLMMGVSQFEAEGSPSETKKIVDSWTMSPPSLTFETNRNGVVKHYTAKNNKMITYPYKFFTVDNYSGALEQFKYEDFIALKPSFDIRGICFPKPVISAYPKTYKMATKYSQQSINYDDFPAIGWINAAFSPEIYKYAQQPFWTAASTLINAVGGNAADTAMGIFNTIKSGVTSYQNYKYDEKVLHSRQYKSGTATGALNFSEGRVGFRFTGYSVTAEMAEVIDRKMTRYGYTINTYKRPNIKGRQYVNYVKTSGARVAGKIPVETKEVMERALNSGVSFWHTNDMSLGEDYNNPIVGG